METSTQLKVNFESLYAEMSGRTFDCTSSTMCREVHAAALELTDKITAVPLTQMVMSYLCYTNSCCNPSLDDVAYLQHENALDFIKRSLTLNPADAAICKAMCMDVHMTVINCPTLLSVA